jgi:hypothetical protein
MTKSLEWFFIPGTKMIALLLLAMVIMYPSASNAYIFYVNPYQSGTTMGQGSSFGYEQYTPSNTENAYPNANGTNSVFGRYIGNGIYQGYVYHHGYGYRGYHHMHGGTISGGSYHSGSHGGYRHSH